MCEWRFASIFILLLSRWVLGVTPSEPVRLKWRHEGNGRDYAIHAALSVTRLLRFMGSMDVICYFSNIGKDPHLFAGGMQERAWEDAYFIFVFFVFMGEQAALYV